MSYFRIFVLSTILASVGCTTTKITSVKDPEYANEIFRKPVVHASIIGLEHQLALEESLLSAFGNSGITAIPGTKVFPPTRKLEDQKIGQALSKSGGDSLITVKLLDGTTERQKYEITLLSFKTAKIVWVGDSSTKFIYGSNIGTENMSLTLMFDSLAKSIVKQLLEEGLLAQ